jgi:hypothetical protein
LQNASLEIRACAFEFNRSGRKVVYDWGDGYVDTWWEDAESTAAVCATGAPVRISDCVFRGNASTQPEMWWGGDVANAGAILMRDSEGSVVERCDFLGNSGAGAGAIALEGADVAIIASRFLRNLSLGNGGAVAAACGWDGGWDPVPSTAAFTNCLLLGNRAQSDGSDLDFGDGCQVRLLHTTVAGGFARGGHAIRLGGDSSAVNSIVAGNTSLAEGISFTARGNCTPDDWSAYGTGNLSSDPMLTGAGMLKAGSPCIDAGSAATAPAADLFGNARPAGSAPDIGCHEFLDTDADGIPDFLEGSGVLPNGDADSDGLTNLQEYLLGTGLFAADTDGDGIADGAEAAQGDDPAWPTRTIHVSPSGSDAGDGLTAATAKATFAAALELTRDCAYENIVLAAAGTYAGAGNRGLDFEGFDVILRGASAAGAVVDLEGAGRFLALVNGEGPGSRLERLSVRNGAADKGSAIFIQGGAPVIRECAFTGCVASDGGAVYVEGRGGTRLEECRFEGNRAGSGAAVNVGRDGGVAMEGCLFQGNYATGGGGALFIFRGAVQALRCRFLHNLARNDGGAAYLRDEEASAAFADCLFLGNRSLSSSSALHGNHWQQQVELVNCTFAGGGAANRLACHFEGTARLVNTILHEGFSHPEERPPTVACCVVATAAQAALGSGNLVADPMLTGAGMLKAGSPCIDAGSAADAPAADLFGNARPAGNGPDIGCHEFQDTDADGIPDFLEGAAGLLPGGDADNDGLTNLQEYLLGTDLFQADTDGDGIADAAEIAQGFDPLLPTRKVYVDAADGDDAGGGLSAATAKRTLAAAVAAAKRAGFENVVAVAPGTYRGAGNRGLDFDGFDIKLVGTAGAAQTIVDLEGAGPFLSLSHAETLASRLEGLAVRNGYAASGGIAVHLL